VRRAASGGGRDDFGEPELVSSDIAPTRENQRTLTGGRERILWIALGAGCVAPLLGDYAGESVILGVVGAVLMAIVVTMAGLLASSTAVRYGVGAGALTRAAYGTQPAVAIHLLRYAIGVVWTAAHLAPIAGWLSKLTDASLRAFGPSFDLEWTGSEALLSYAVLALLGAIIGWTARGRIRRSRKMGWFALAVAIAGVAALAYTLIKHGIPVMPGARPFDVQHIAPAVADGLVLAWAVPEWVRYRQRKGGLARPLLRAPIAAGALAFVLLLMSAIALALRSRSDGSLIGDAAGVFGLGFGWAGAGVELAVLFGVLPLFGVLTASLALCTAFPKYRYPYVAYVTAAIATALAMLYSPPLWITALLAPPLAAIIVDEQLVRRGTVRVLEELYSKTPGRVVPFVATLAGCAIIAIGHNRLSLALPCAMLLAMLGAALGNVRLPSRKRPKTRAKGPTNWGEPLPLGEHDWAPGDETRIEDPRKKP
jgi:cytosine/uracil/thiamine/allantoin permease